MGDETLAEEVAALSDQVKVLREVLDEIRMELGWANDNARDFVHGAGAVTDSWRIVSMARDPTARDFTLILFRQVSSNNFVKRWRQDPRAEQQRKQRSPKEPVHVPVFRI